ncbi:MAG: AraC family transcriptional regulator [Spirochaetaceae bacterium]|jgi:AraC-like DNA-binding protein|nr:AraC family transcriptional regulator [Spirochaetaceae bacterium]
MQLKHASYGDKLIDGPDMEYHGRMHAHEGNDYECHVFLEGRGLFEIDKKRYNIEPGSIFLLRPGEFHSILPGKVSVPLGYYIFIFDPDEGESKDERVTKMLQAPQSRLIKLYSRDHIIVQEIHHLFWQKKMAERIAASAMFSGLLFHWYGASIIEDTVDAKETARNINRMHIDKSIFYLKKHPNKNISVRELAKMQNLSAEHLSRIFTKEMGISPHQYITRLKMEEAIFRLINTDAGLDEIAEALGFSDAFHFSHVFTKTQGISPARYRQNNTPADNHHPQTDEKYAL